MNNGVNSIKLNMLRYYRINLGDTKKTPSYSSGLYFSDFKDKSERGALKCSKICSKSREKVNNGLLPIKKVDKDDIVPINVIS